MSYKRSAYASVKNKTVHTRNLSQFQDSLRMRRPIVMETSPLEERNRMPLKSHLVGRYLYLGSEMKGRKNRISLISKEVLNLWANKLNFPNVSHQQVQAKVMDTYDHCTRAGKYEKLNELFDITKVNGDWLSSEDKQLYSLQMETKGEKGYSRSLFERPETVHPRKRRKLSVPEPSTSAPDYPDLSSSETDSEPTSSDEDFDIVNTRNRKHHTTKLATHLVTATKVSTNKAAEICQQLSLSGLDIPTPSQSAVYKPTFREARKLKKYLVETLKEEKWSLHFDGKIVDGHEYQIVLIKNERREVKLNALCLNDGKAETIAAGIGKTLDEFNLWSAISMIVVKVSKVA